MENMKEAPLDVQIGGGVLGTTAIAEGDPDRVQKWVDSYLRQYHPMGYGTSIREDETEDGTRRVKIHRYNSCN